MVFPEVHNGGSLDDGIVDSLNKHQIASSDLLHLYPIPPLQDIQLAGILNKHILIIPRLIVLPQDPKLIILLESPRKHAAKHIKCFVI